MDPGIALGTHRLLMRMALAAGNAFAWIFIFEFFFILDGNIALAIARVALLYALSQLVTSLSTPAAARTLGNGMKNGVIFGTVIAAGSFIFLGAIFQGSFGPFYIFALLGFALLSGFYRALYWVPYEVERHEHRGMSPQGVNLAYEVLIALMPAFAGLIMATEGVREAWLLFATGIVMLVSLLPLIAVPDIYEKFPWSYRETFGQLFARAHRRLFFGAIIDGIQGAALLLIWPLAIFLILGWSYPLFGLLFSFTFLLLIVARGTVEVFMRRLRIHDSLPVRVALVSSAWIGRVLVVNPLSIIIVDAYAHTGNPKVSTDHLTFQQSSDAGHYIDEYTALREIGLSIGRIVLCAIGNPRITIGLRRGIHHRKLLCRSFGHAFADDTAIYLNAHRELSGELPGELFEKRCNSFLHIIAICGACKFFHNRAGKLADA
jgi:hypothetical protein